jgi:hypothetical protein
MRSAPRFPRALGRIGPIHWTLGVATDSVDDRTSPIRCTLAHASTQQKGHAMRGLKPTVSYGDSLSIGQLADRFRRSPEFVRGLIVNGDHVVNDRGLVTTRELSASTSPRQPGFSTRESREANLSPWICVWSVHDDVA